MKIFSVVNVLLLAVIVCLIIHFAWEDARTALVEFIRIISAFVIKHWDIIVMRDMKNVKNVIQYA